MRPFTPELIGWIRDFGQGASNYDANGHYARIQPIFDAFSFADNPAGGVLNPIPPSSRFDFYQSDLLKRCPGAASQPPEDGSAPFLDDGASAATATRHRCRPGHEARRSPSSSCSPSRSRRSCSAPAAATAARYKVRAIFDDAGNIIPGEDVKIAGVKVGKVDSLDVTPDDKAAVVARTSQDPASRTSARDASCTIRPQSLIGEKFVDCTPTQPRAPGDAAAAAAQEDRQRRRAGPVPAAGRRTRARPVDVDLIDDIMRAARRQRLTLILNELGAGLAGRGARPREVIHRANPALQRNRPACSRSSRSRTRCSRARESTATRSSRRWRASASTSAAS